MFRPRLTFEMVIARIDFDGPNGCWLWSYPVSRNGYGQIGRRGAHRVLYEELIGPIPDGLHIDHLCRIKVCVNPWHMETVTCRVNILRGEGLPARNARKLACPRGHTYDLVLSTGSRWCSICSREARRRHRERTA